MTYLIVQVKNRHNDSLTNALRNKAKDTLKSAAGLLPTSSAHLGILMSLRSREEQQMDVVYPVAQPAQRQPSGRQRKKTGNTHILLERHEPGCHCRRWVWPSACEGTTDG